MMSHLPTTISEFIDSVTHPKLYAFYDDLELSLQLKIITAWPYLIYNFKNPSRKLIKHHLTNYPLYIGNIDNPDEELQLIAVNNDHPFSSLSYVPPITKIQNPTNSVVLLVAGLFGSDLSYVRNPSFDAVMLAVRHQGWSIAYMPKPWSCELRMAAAQNYGIHAILNPTPDEQMAAIYNNPYEIKHIANPTDEVQISAVIADPKCITFIDNPCIQAILAAK